MTIVKIGNLVVKLVDENEKTLIRTHAMKDGKWAVSQGSLYKEMSEVAAKELFKVKATALILGASL